MSPDSVTSPSPLPGDKRLHWTVAFACTALAYALAAGLGLLLAMAPGHASPLYPSAGIALVCTLVYGKRMALAAGLAAFLVNLALGHHRGMGMAALWPAAMIGAGAMAQALVGALLVRRHVRFPMSLSEPRDIALFFVLGALVACLVSASVASVALGWSGAVPFHRLGFNWLTWWTGDALGVLVAAPIVLTLIGRPRREWAPRRLTVGLTLFLAGVLLALGLHQVTRLEFEGTRGNFEREAANAASLLQSNLKDPLNALDAMASAHTIASDLTRAQFEQISENWLARNGQLQAMGWAEKLYPEGIERFERIAEQEGVEGLRVHSRAENARLSPTALGEAIVAVRFIEPMSRNAKALGLDVLSVPEGRAAVDITARTGLPRVSEAFRLRLDPADSPNQAVVIHQAIYLGNPRTEEERIAAFRGTLFVTLRMNEILNTVQDRASQGLEMCLVDTDPLTPRRRLAGPEACEQWTLPLRYARNIAFAGRTWELRIGARPENVVGSSHVDTWLLSMVGLGSATMLGALLLTVSGRTRRIEAAVNERTAALQQEVVEREHAEEALRESEQRFRNIFNIVPIGVAYADLRGQLKQVNPRFCELVGYDVDEVLTMNAFDFTHPDEASQDVAWSRQLVLGEIDDFRRETRFIRKDGSVFWVKSTVSLLRDAAGHPSRIVAAVEDITEHLLLGEAEQARKAAEAANTAKSEFLSRMSHELRTPLNAMLGFAQLLEMNSQHPLGPTQRPWVAQIQQAGWHLLDMINDVLDLSRIESGHLELHPQVLRLQHLLSSTLPLVEQDAQRRGIRIAHNLAPDALLLEGDATRVKQILTNLLSNAVKYNIEGGRIHVSAQRKQAMIEVTVTDTGLGMTPEQVGQLFQPFNRLGRDRSAIEGTGIGLVISQRLAELMGGELTVDSVPGQGSAFTLSLPAVQEEAAPHSGHATLAAAEPAYNQRTVHYVEDNETNVEVMRGILALRPQIRLTVSTTGLEGLAAIRAHRPDVVLLDMHLPDITGMEVLEELKAEPLTASIPVVVVSADAVASQIEAALDAGAVRYLTKPVGVSELLSSLDAVLDGVDTRFG